MEGGITLVRRFEAEVDDLALPYLLNLTVGVHRRRLAIEGALILQRRGGSPVTSAGLRLVVLDAYLGAVRKELGALSGAFLLATVKERTPRSVSWSPPSVEEWLRFEDEQRRSLPRRETLHMVAEAYQEALADPDPEVFRKPTAAVAKRLHYSRGHISRLLTEARESKPPLLGPAHTGRAGERTEPDGQANNATRPARSGMRERR